MRAQAIATGDQAAANEAANKAAQSAAEAADRVLKAGGTPAAAAEAAKQATQVGPCFSQCSACPLATRHSCRKLEQHTCCLGDERALRCGCIYLTPKLSFPHCWLPTGTCTPSEPGPVSPTPDPEPSSRREPGPVPSSRPDPLSPRPAGSAHTHPRCPCHPHRGRPEGH